MAILCIAVLKLQSQPLGWASVGGVTDGANGRNPIVVSSYHLLAEYLTSMDTLPLTIYISGRIEFPERIRIRKKRNLTLVGLEGSMLINDRHTHAKDSTGILFFDKCENIVLRNLTFKGPGAFDIDGYDNLCLSDTRRVWVDHCDFQDGVDGNFDCIKASDYITVSWCRFRYLKKPWKRPDFSDADKRVDDHRFSNLWGGSDKDEPFSAGKLRTTFHHCWWDDGCRRRMPFVRFGKVHVLNCLYSSNAATCYIQARFRSNIFVESCAFVSRPRKVKLFQPSTSTDYPHYNIRVRGCVGFRNQKQRFGEESYFVPSDYYDYEAQDARDVEKTVRAYAGATLWIHMR